MVLMTDAFQGKELTRSDLQGAAVYVEGGLGISLGLGIGWSGTAMLMGINPGLLLLGLSMPGSPITGIAIGQARAVLLMHGLNIGAGAGTQIGGGVGLLIGYVH